MEDCMLYARGGRNLVCPTPKLMRFWLIQRLSLLKRYRHGAFHFQRDYFDSRFMEFQAEQKSAIWVRDLSDALGRWFLEWFEARRTPSTPSESSNYPPEA